MGRDCAPAKTLQSTFWHLTAVSRSNGCALILTYGVPVPALYRLRCTAAVVRPGRTVVHGAVG